MNPHLRDLESRSFALRYDPARIITWWARSDSNGGPIGYEPIALPIELRAPLVDFGIAFVFTTNDWLFCSYAILSCVEKTHQKAKTLCQNSLRGGPTEETQVTIKEVYQNKAKKSSVRRGGLEPPSLTAYAPQAYEFTSFSTCA